MMKNNDKTTIKMIKRKRGGQSQKDKFYFKLRQVVDEGNNRLLEAYPDAIGLLINTLQDETASHTNRITCARMIKESAEEIVDTSELDIDVDPEPEPSTAPVFRIE